MNSDISSTAGEPSPPGKFARLWRRMRRNVQAVALNVVTLTCRNATRYIFQNWRYGASWVSENNLADAKAKQAVAIAFDNAESSEDVDVASMVHFAEHNQTVQRLRSIHADAVQRLESAKSGEAQRVLSVLRDLWQDFWSWRYAKSIARAELRARSADNALVIDSTGADIAQLATLGSVCLVVGSFFYQRIFFSELGVDATRYLTISDYLSTSVGVLSSAAVSIGVNVFPMFLSTLNNEMAADLAAEKFRIGIASIAKIFTWIIIAVSIFDAFKDEKAFYSILPLAAWCVSLRWLPAWSYRHFKRPMFITFFALFIVYFGAKIYSDAHLNAMKVKDGTYFKSENVAVEFIKGDEFEKRAGSLRLLENTSNYVILYDDSVKKVIFTLRGC